MSPSLFILTITCYLVSMGAALIVSFFSKMINARIINTIIIFHFLTLLTWIILPKAGFNISEPVTANYMFLVFFCSGIIIAGLILRRHFIIYLKIYFALFLLSLLVFIISPSRVIGFVASGNIHSINPKRFHISENYFFVEQQQSESSLPGDSGHYKLVREMGMFHKTLARNVKLPLKTDSIKLNRFVDDKQLFVWVYSSAKGNANPSELIIDLNSVRDSSRIITRKPQP